MDLRVVDMLVVDVRFDMDEMTTRSSDGIRSSAGPELSW